MIFKQLLFLTHCDSDSKTIDLRHPHPLNHVRFRALSCTLYDAGLTLFPGKTVSQYEETDFLKRGEAVGWKRFRVVTLSRLDSGIPSI